MPRVRSRLLACLTLLTAILFHPNLLHTQISTLRVSTPSPTVASLGTFGDIPISLYTGMPDVSIPLLSVKGRTLQVPISLRYQGAIKVEDIGGWVGIGWALEAGGVITRTVRGLPDDDYDGYLYTGHVLYTGTNWTSPPAALLDNIRDGFVDPEPDQYFFSLLGRSGQFFHGRDSLGVITRAVPFQDLQITPTVQGRGSPITAWTITTEDGTRYTFAAQEIHTDRTSGSLAPPNKQTLTYTVSWHLTEIRTPGDDVVTLNYTPYTVDHAQGKSEQRLDFVQSTAGQCSPSVSSSFNRYTATVQRLTSIVAAGATATFVPGDVLRQDALSPLGAAQEPRLDKIVLASPAGGTLKQIVFQHTYTVGGRLTLQGLQEQDRNGVSLPPYSFTYNSSFLPPIQSNDQDHWGYYNGAGNSTLIPLYEKDGVVLAGANREIVPSKAQAGILERITYPTGGMTEFMWEANDYGSVAGNVPVGVQKSSTSIPPSIGEETTFTVPGPNSAVVSVAYSRGPSGCEELYFSCPYSTLTGPGVNWTFTGDGSSTATLAPGTYTLRTLRNTLGEAPPDPWAQIAVEWQDSVVVKKKLGGGFRVAAIRDMDGAGHTKTTSYRYTLHADTTTSSGVISVEPVYAYWFIGPFCTYLARGSASRMPLGDGAGAIGYREVSVLHGASDEAGVTVHRFRSALEEPDPAPSGDWPFGRRNSLEWKRGQEFEVVEYNATGDLVRQQRKTYAFRDETSTQPANVSVLRGLSVNFFNDGNTVQDEPANARSLFQVTAGWMYQDGDSTWSYGTAGSGEVIATRKFVYGNPVHAQLTEQVESQSDGSERITRLRYAPDYPAGSGTPEADALAAMAGAAHMHSQVIEKVIIARVQNTETVVRAELTTYKAYQPGQYLPYKRFVLDNPQPVAVP